MAKRTEKMRTWLTYAAAGSTRLFGKWKVIPALVAVLLGLASPAGSSGDDELGWFAALIFVVVTISQAGSTVLLFRLDRQGFRTALSAYYASAGFFCLAVTVGAAFRSVIGPFLAVMMSLGLVAIAFTAFYLLKNWDELAQAQPDAAIFLGSTHVLALVAIVAAAVRALFAESGEWVAALTQTTYLSLTALALPLAAGLWVRLSVHARAKANTELATHPEVHTEVEMASLSEASHTNAHEHWPRPVETSATPQILKHGLPSGPSTTNVLTAAAVAALVTLTVLSVNLGRRR